MRKNVHHSVHISLALSLIDGKLIVHLSMAAFSYRCDVDDVVTLEDEDKMTLD